MVSPISFPFNVQIWCIYYGFKSQVEFYSFSNLSIYFLANTLNTCWCIPTLLKKLKCESKNENNEKRSWGTLPNLQHFEGRRTCWSFEMGTRITNKWINCSHKPAQPKQQVGYCMVGALLIHGLVTSIHWFTRLTMAQTWGKPAPSPSYYSLY